MPNLFPPAARTAAGTALALAVFLAAAPGAVAGSIVMAARATPSEEAAPPARSSFATPAAARSEAAPSAANCATEYHSLLQAIAANELAALRALDPAVGVVDPSLPGRLLVAQPARAVGPHAGAAKAAVDLAQRQGRAIVPQGANARWIAGRIEEDLTDYLRQGPSPFLCSGVANYLSTLRTFASQLGGSAQGRTTDIALQKETATASIHAAHASLHQPAIPEPAPEHRGGSGLVSSVSMRSVPDAPVRVAERADGGITASDASRQPHAEFGTPLPLATATDRLAAIDGLLDLARRNGLIAPDAVVANARGRELEEAALADGRPVLVRLQRSAPLVSAMADGPQRSAFLTALADIEALDYLAADADGTSDPVGSALADTMNAIEAAHAKACACED